MNALDTAIERARKALDGDSNDAEHDALYSLVNLLTGKPESLAIGRPPWPIRFRRRACVTAVVEVPVVLRHIFAEELFLSVTEVYESLSDGVPITDLDVAIDDLTADAPQDEQTLAVVAFLERVRDGIEADDYLFT